MQRLELLVEVLHLASGLHRGLACVSGAKGSHRGTHMLLRDPALQSLESMSLKHDLARLWGDPDAVDEVHRHRYDTESGGRAPEVTRVQSEQGGEWESFKIGDQVWAEFEIEREEGSGEECVAEEIDGEDAGLKQSECLAWYYGGVSGRELEATWNVRVLNATMPPINVCQTWKPNVIPHARTYPPRRVAGAWSQALVARVSEEMEEPMVVETGRDMG